MPLPSLKLMDYADPELLSIVDDVADDEGWARSRDIAAVVGIDAKFANQCVGSRFAWMKRYGWLDKHPTESLWKLTPIGEALMDGRVNKTVEKMLNSLKPGDRIRVTRMMAETTMRMDYSASTMARREWRRNTRPSANGGTRRRRR